MSRERNLATQARLGDYIINGGHLEALEEVFADDVVDHDPAPDQGPGPEGLRHFFTGLSAAFPDAHVHVDQIVADDEFVTIAYRLTGTHLGVFNGIEPTGKKIHARGMQLARFRDGKIVERWGSSDQLGILQQLGATSAT